MEVKVKGQKLVEAVESNFRWGKEVTGKGETLDRVKDKV